MARSGGPGGADWEEFSRRLQAQLGSVLGHFGAGARGGLFLGAFALVLLAWMATGVYTVDPDEQALVRQFGQVSGTTGPGLQWRWPAPIARHDKVQVTKQRSMELGFRTQEFGVVTHAVEALMITGDENIVDVEVVVLYRVANIEEYLLRVRDPGDLDRGIGDSPEGRTLKDAAEVALRGIVGSRPIDDVLTLERSIMEAQVRDVLQQLLDDYHTGLLVTGVQLQTVKPPTQVQAAFNDVVSAKEDKSRLINEAEAYAADIVPRARGDAERILNEAKAFESQRINDARGRAAEFLSILEEYRKAPEVTRTRLYLETMERVLPDVKKVIMDPELGGSVLPFLPLQDLQSGKEATP